MNLLHTYKNRMITLHIQMSSLNHSLSRPIEEVPNLIRNIRPRSTIPTTLHRRRTMSTIKRNPRNRESRPTPRISRLNMRPASTTRLPRALRRAAVVLDETIPQPPSHIDRQNIVIDAVNTKVRNRIVTAFTPADQASGNHSNGLELFAARARDGVRHAAAIREASGEALSFINTQVRFDSLAHGIEERDILPAGVSPAGVQAVGCDENGAFSGFLLLAVVRPLSAVGAPRGDVVHGAAARVPGKDQLVGLAVGVAGGDAQGVLALLAVDVDRVYAVLEGWSFAAASGVGALGEGVEVCCW